MRIDMPVFIKTGPKLYRVGDSVCLKDKTGNITWCYHGKRHKGIAIVACARSATMYTVHVLRALGYQIGHEEMGEDGSIGYHLVAIKPKNCFHQVREPIKQISSMVAHNSWGFMLDVVDINDTNLLGCMQYWLKWNELCEEFCVWRYQIERFPDVWPEFLDRIGHEQCELPNIKTDINSSKQEKYRKKKKYKLFTWADLFNEDRELAQQIKEKAEYYGYSPIMDKELTDSNPGQLERAMVASV